MNIVYQAVYGGPRMTYDYEIVIRPLPRPAHATCYLCGCAMSCPDDITKIFYCGRCKPAMLHSLRERQS